MATNSPQGADAFLQAFIAFLNSRDLQICAPNPDSIGDEYSYFIADSDVLDRAITTFLHPDALIGILNNAVANQGGYCLICKHAKALYCSTHCADRGR